MKNKRGERIGASFSNLAKKLLLNAITVIYILTLIPSFCIAASPQSYSPTDFIISPGAGYDKGTRLWQGCPTIEKTGSRLWAGWYTGGDKEPAYGNYVVIVSSDDNGDTWSDPAMVLVHSNDTVRVESPLLWLDPNETRLWLFWSQNQGSGPTDNYGKGVWASYTDNPTAATPVWSAPERKSDGWMINKPIVLSTGEWVLPVYDFVNEDITKVYISENNGATFSYQGEAVIPNTKFDEHMIVEKENGDLWMLVRSTLSGEDGILQSFSTDKGKTWSECTSPKIGGPNSRFHIKRLNSGKLLLVNHYDFNNTANFYDVRQSMTAMISEDDGETWQENKLLLDERRSVSYPDATQDSLLIIMCKKCICIIAEIIF